MQNAIYLIIHILFAIGMFISLKMIDVKRLNKYKAIAMNYFTAMLLTLADLLINDARFDFPLKLLFPSVFVGLLFVTSFVAITYSAQKVGIGLTTAFNKMSVVIPVVVGVLYLGQKGHLPLKIAGIILALISFVLILYKKPDKRVRGAFVLPLIVLLLSGMIDTSMELTNTFVITQPAHQEKFLLGVFCVAFLLSFTASFFIKERDASVVNNYKVVLYGLILGIFNFLTSKMILVNVGRMGGSVVFPVHNAAVVMFTALAGVIFFSERFTKKQWIGVFVAVLAVFIIAYTL